MTFTIRSLGPSVCIAAAGLVLAAAGCGGGSSSATTPPVPLSISLGTSTVVVPQDGAAAAVPLTIVGPTGTPSVSVTGLPSGVAEQFAAAAGSLSGTLTFTGSASLAAGSYPSTVTVTLAGQSANASVTLVSAVVAKVSNSTDTTLGVKGVLKQFMATSFQIAEWTVDVFGAGASTTAREGTLSALEPQHIRLQALSQAIPMKAHTGAATDWDFTLLDQTLQPVLVRQTIARSFKSPPRPLGCATAAGIWTWPTT